MDTIRISIDPTNVGYDELENIVNIFINGRHLIDIIKEKELKLALPNNFIAGSYIGVHMPWFRDFYHLRGGYRNGKVLLLQCEDFDAFGCWDLVVKVTIDNDTVTWSDFEQPHRGPSSSEHWVYNLKFVFDRKQYETELSKCGIMFEK